jgi:hypothetical protein
LPGSTGSTGGIPSQPIKIIGEYIWRASIEIMEGKEHLMCGRAPSSEEVEQLERPESEETLTEISSIRWNRQGHHPVREEVRGSAPRAVEEIAAF